METLTNIKDINCFTSGVVAMYNEMLTINPAKQMKFTVEEVEDHYYITFTWIYKVFSTPIGNDPSYTPEPEYDSYGFEYRLEQPVSELVDSLMVALDLVIETKIKYS